MERTRINPFSAIISMFKTNTDEQGTIEVEKLTDSDYEEAGVTKKDLEASSKRIEKMEKELNNIKTKYKVDKADVKKSKATKSVTSKQKEKSDIERE